MGYKKVDRRSWWIGVDGRRAEDKAMTDPLYCHHDLLLASVAGGCQNLECSVRVSAIPQLWYHSSVYNMATPRARIYPCCTVSEFVARPIKISRKCLTRYRRKLLTILIGRGNNKEEITVRWHRGVVLADTRSDEQHRKITSLRLQECNT